MDYRAVLYFPNYTFDVSDINEDMEQSSAVNPVEADADFAIGVSSKSELKFSVNNKYELINENSLADKEFLLQRGKVTSYTTVLDVYKKVRKPLFVQQGGFTFAASDRKPYLSVYNSDFILQDAPEQPLQPVKSLFIVGGKLYCIHDVEPTITAYSVSGGILTIQPQILLTDFYKSKLMAYAKNGRCFNKQGDTVTEYVFLYEDMKVSDVIAETWQYSNFGYYTVRTAEKINDTKISVIAYDRMQKFEVVADAFLDSLIYPIPLKFLLIKLCTFIGVIWNSKTLINENYSVPSNFKTEGVTARQVLQWIAQISASFAYIDFNGDLNLSWYTNADSPIDAHNSTVIDIADYIVKPIDKVQAKAFETDIGIIVPLNEQKTNAYIIENNPLLYATSDAQIRPAITNIYNAIKSFSYVPFTAKTYVVDENIRAGMFIPATTVKETNFLAYVMQSTLKGATGLTAEYSATGNEYRKTKVDSVNQKLIMLNGRTNKIIANIEEFSVTLDEVKNAGEQNTAQIKVQAGEITAEVKRASEAEGKLSASVNIQAGQIALKASQETVNLLGNRVESAESAITQNAEQITLRVSETIYNENNLQISNHFSSLEQTISGFKLSVDNNKLIFDADGLTVINGGFKIKNSAGESIFSVSLSGNVSAIGTFISSDSTRTTELGTGGLYFYSRNYFVGSIIPSPTNGIYVSGNTFFSGNISASIGSGITIDNVSCERINCYGPVSCTSLTIGFSSLTKTSQTVVTGIMQIGDQITPITTILNYWR